MAYTKNPDRYPPEYTHLLDSLASKTFSPKTVTYPNHKQAVTARQMLLAFRAALKHRSISTPTDFTRERYQLSLTLTTSLLRTLEGTTLTIATSLAQAPLWAASDILVAAASAPIKAPAPEGPTEADTQMLEYYQMVGDRLVKELQTALFVRTYQHHTLPENPQLAIDFAFNLLPDFKLNLKMEEIITELMASESPIRLPTS